MKVTHFPGPEPEPPRPGTANRPRDVTRSERNCHDCHRDAVIQVLFGAKRPPLRLCARCMRFLIGRAGALLPPADQPTEGGL